MIAFDRSFAADYTRLLEVEAAAFNETVPGKTMGEVFQKICTAYDKIGMPEEWRRHHQGGLTRLSGPGDPRRQIHRACGPGGGGVCLEPVL